MLLRSCFFLCSLVTLLFPLALSAQITSLNSAQIKQGLERLSVLGSVLYFAAHPDDENTRLIAWLAQEQKYRTAYLSLTRGEGGQNLIGTDLGVDLGLIRTQELLAARHIDKGEQFFSSAYDFGFSKTHQETFKFWDKEKVLSEAVYIIRKLQPDVIITRFPPDKRGGHGHHQASAILAHEAFIAAADPKRFPEQLKTVQIWQATRLVWNTANFGGMNNTSEDQLKIDIGAYNPLLGQSYGEIAALSRSQHKSQGFGAASTRGQQIEYFEHVAGTEAKSTLTDDVNTSWGRIAGTEKIQQLIQDLNSTFEPNHPKKSVPALFALRKEVQKIPDEYWKAQKTKEIEDLIIACAGIWIEATSAQPQVTISRPFQTNVEAIVRNPNTAVEIVSINGLQQQIALAENRLWKGQVEYAWNNPTQPYWLRDFYSYSKKYYVSPEYFAYPTRKEKPSLKIELRMGNETLLLNRDIQFRSVDPVQGEVYQDLAVVPQLTVTTNERMVLFTDTAQKQIEVTFTNNDPQTKKYQRVKVHSGWKEWRELDFSNSDTLTKQVTVSPQSLKKGRGVLAFSLGGEKEAEALRSIKTIAYDHIPVVTWFPATEVQLRYVDLINQVKKVGYINGAGDLVPQSLTNIGIEVTTLKDNQIEAGYLAQFDAVVVGVRYFNVDEQSNNAMQQLLKYAEQGGVVLVQYNVNSRLHASNLGPYPFQLSRKRVTEEDAPVPFDKNDPALNHPNKITEADFDGWVQERGLYFAENIDKRYRTPLAMNDKGEASHNGSLLIAPYGKGKFVYTSLSFFRQLPAGVPGAYRLFLNLLNKEQ